MSKLLELTLSLTVELRGEWTPAEAGWLLQTILRLRDAGKLPSSISVSLSFITEGTKMVVVGSPDLHPNTLAEIIAALKKFLEYGEGKAGVVAAGRD